MDLGWCPLAAPPLEPTTGVVSSRSPATWAHRVKPGLTPSHISVHSWHHHLSTIESSPIPPVSNASHSINPWHASLVLSLKCHLTSWHPTSHMDKTQDTPMLYTTTQCIIWNNISCTQFIAPNSMHMHKTFRDKPPSWKSNHHRLHRLHAQNHLHEITKRFTQPRHQVFQ